MANNTSPSSSSSPSAEEIQRILFLCPRIHIYAIPPLRSNLGYKASDWNVENERSRIFTARLRIIETSTISVDPNAEDKIRTDIRLEDPDSGELFANCPYEGAFCVEQVIDSSRFYAVRVIDGPRKAYLGIGFEDRSDSFEFGVCLQEVRRHNGLDNPKVTNESKKDETGTNGKQLEALKKDYSLKDGETISITIGNKGRRKPSSNSREKIENSHDISKSNADTDFPLPFLPPPPSAEDVRKRLSLKQEDFSSIGFDDDPFGDFV